MSRTIFSVLALLLCCIAASIGWRVLNSEGYVSFFPPRAQIAGEYAFSQSSIDRLTKSRLSLLGSGRILLSENGDVECIGGRLSISLGSEKDPAVICEIIPEGATRGEWHYQKDASNLHYIQVLYETSDGDRDVAFLMKKAPEGYDLYLIFDPDIYLPPMTRIK